MEYLLVDFRSQRGQPIDRGVVFNNIHGSWRTNTVLYLAAGTYQVTLEPGAGPTGQQTDDFTPSTVNVVLQFTNPFDPARIEFTSTI